MRAVAILDGELRTFDGVHEGANMLEVLDHRVPLLPEGEGREGLELAELRDSADLLFGRGVGAGLFPEGWTP